MVSSTGKYTENMPLGEKLVYVLTQFEAATIDEIVEELTELDGIAAQEAITRLYNKVEEKLQVLMDQDRVRKRNKRFFLVEK